MTNGDTIGNKGNSTIRFDLWVVLAFLVALVGIGMGYLFNAQAVAREDRTKAISQVCDRVTRLETQYYYIAEGIKDLKEGQKEVVATIKKKKGNGFL